MHQRWMVSSAPGLEEEGGRVVSDRGSRTVSPLPLSSSVSSQPRRLCHPASRLLPPCSCHAGAPSDGSLKLHCY